MTIVTPIDCAMRFAEGGGAEYGPGEGAVFQDLVAEWVADGIRKGEPPGKARMSAAGNYTRRFRWADAKPGDVLISWRGCGLGDQVIWGGMLRTIARLCPGLIIHHYCLQPSLWEGAEDLPFTPMQSPIPFDAWREAHWHLCGEGLYEDDTEPTQPDCWTGQLLCAGIDEHLVPTEERLPLIPLSAADRDAAVRLLAEVYPGAGWDASGGRGDVSPQDPPNMRGDTAEAAGSPRGAILPDGRIGEGEAEKNGGWRVLPKVAAAAIDAAGGAGSGGPASGLSAAVSARSNGESEGPRSLGGGTGAGPRSSSRSRPLVLWQVCATTPVRSYPPTPTREAMRLVVEAGADILAMGSPKQLARYGPFPEGVTVQPEGTQLRTLFAAVELADCVVCPDSIFGWVAAGVGVPAVSLWGAFLPTDRVGSHSSHRPIVGEAPCVPCRKHEKPWLEPGCPEHGGGYCRALATIDPGAVAHAVKETITCP